jgi:SOS-response transcriptional repressor LexA
MEGDSMKGAGIWHGDYVILEERVHKSGDIIAAQFEEEITLKHYHFENGKHLLRTECEQPRDVALDDAPDVKEVVVGLIRRM